VSLKCPKKVSGMAFRLFMHGPIVGNRQRWNGRRAVFTIDDLMQDMGLNPTTSNRDYVHRQVKAALVELTSITVSATTLNRGSERWFHSCGTGPFLSWGEIEARTGVVSMVFSEEVLSALAVFFQLLPQWVGQVRDIRALQLAQLVYSRLMRGKTPGKVEIATRDILASLGLPMEKEEVAGRKYAREMMNPVVDAIRELGRVSGDRLEIVTDWKEGINGFLGGTTRFTVRDADAVAFYERIQQSRLERAKRRKHASQRRSVAEKNNADKRMEETTP
jgi:hypothetical protein